MKGHVRERGKGNWYAVLDVSDPQTGKRKRKWHKLEASGKKEAQTECSALVTQLTSGSYIDAKKITVAEYLERWLTATKPSVSPRTFERYVELVRKNIVPLLGGTQLKKLNGIQIAEAYTKGLESGRRDGSGGLSPQTVLHMHRVLKGALKQAVLWKLVHFNEAAAVKPPKPDKRRMMQPTFITHEWVRAIKETALPRIRFHDLRHAHATHMLSSGVHPKVASERLGHSKVGITLDLYSHVLPGMQEDAVAKVDAAYKAAAKPREQA
jgi:site-specific recombinase XerC